ncbi:MAG: hybrid sensor histidine kinase/response regulator [Proteobacteria bacterium]|nr:hybrid sensor histidine kinase/response regulator [Pseudomonadota bacterium]MBU1649212.1 hybrid sensor histidine kinase/response regulator [Pseudomonadota bacterium]
MTKEEEFLKRLLATFRIEAEEHVTAISSGLLELEKHPVAEREKEIIEIIFREAHSLKGAARSVNLSHIELLCQAMESLFSALKRGEMALSTPLFDLLHESTDVVSKLLSIPDTAPAPGERSRVQAMRQKLADALQGKIAPPAKKETVKETIETTATPTPLPELNARLLEERDAEKPLPEPEATAQVEPQPRPELLHTLGAEGPYASSETIRIPATRLDSLLLKAEELMSAKLAVRQHAKLVRELEAMHKTWKEQWPQLLSEGLKGNNAPTGKTGTAAPAATAALNAFLEYNQKFSSRLEDSLLGLRKTTEEDFRSIGTMVNNLLDNMKSVMMLPFSSVVGTFPKLVRDLSREQSKEIDLVMEGGEIEIDKRILQEIKDPLIHLVRNSIDHGIETAETRRQKNKAASGSLKITISQKDSGKIEMIIADNGAGINLDKIKRSALKQGTITAEQAAAMSLEDALALIFESGVTTSSIITTVSGRGLGMAIVREKIENLGGTISIQTAADEGTTFTIQLPLSLATFRGILIQTGGQIFAVPTMNVECIQRVPLTDIKTVENRDTIQLHGKSVSLVRLDQVLELSPKPLAEEDGFISVMAVAIGDKHLAFTIDEVLHEDEILLKSLGKQLSRVRNIAGATVLGSGRVIPILNVSDLIKSALKISAGGTRLAAVAKREKEVKLQSVLVAEDSITARTLFVNILESAGYKVTAAVDGVDAFTKLCDGDFDLVVSDVEMPRLNGFELTERIRDDKRFEEMPVVIVTSLESPEDKKRGIEVGANAYITKQSFDQSNLIEVIQRLI